MKNKILYSCLVTLISLMSTQTLIAQDSLENLGVLKEEASLETDIKIQCKLESDLTTEEQPIALNCKDEKLSPFSVVIQSGGYAGYIAPGISVKFLKHNEASLLMSYVPIESQPDGIWQMNFKYNFNPLTKVHINLSNGEKLGINPLYFGAGVIYGIHKNLFLKEPEQYPSGYYNPTAIRYTFNIGTAVSYKRVTLYVEYNALDVGAIAYFFDKNGEFFRENYSALGLAGIGTLGFGVKINLGKKAERR